ncbi:MAG: serine/threonine protein kinase [Candidatus Eremiobacteraeota bacterium]|nr:serine/threonine protein kinase [Candidatus Eremiobacteraeota bacterium]
MSGLPHGYVLKGRYKILSTLGQGSFSSVYLANDSQWKGNLVALKAISTEHFSEQEYMQLNAHFLQEAAFLMTLKHEGLPRVVEFFAEGSSYYLALQWIAGKNLEEVLLERGRLEFEEVLGWGIELCAILDYLHSREPYPVLLGDLKPSNIILRYDNHVSVVDFGVARQVIPEQHRDFSLVSPGFSPPEQYQSFNVGTSGDVYSLGATLYWLLTGVDLARLRFAIPPLRQHRPEASEELERVLSRCLEFEAKRRYPEIRHVDEELKRILHQVNADAGEFSAGDILSALYKTKKKEL